MCVSFTGQTNAVDHGDEKVEENFWKCRALLTLFLIHVEGGSAAADAGSRQQAREVEADLQCSEAEWKGLHISSLLAAPHVLAHRMHVTRFRPG